MESYRIEVMEKLRLSAREYFSSSVEIEVRPAAGIFFDDIELLVRYDKYAGSIIFKARELEVGNFDRYTAHKFKSALVGLAELVFKNNASSMIFQENATTRL